MSSECSATHDLDDNVAKPKDRLLPPEARPAELENDTFLDFALPFERVTVFGETTRSSSR